MARKVQRLNDRAVKSAKAPGVKADGGGLYLQVANESAKSWLFRFAKDKRERWKGLGAYPAVSLAAARDAAHECRKLLEAGIDPIEHGRATEAAALADAKLKATSAITFKQAAEQYIRDHKAGWRNPKHAEQWSATLTTYAYPIIGDMTVAAVDMEAVLEVLRPIWSTKTVTAVRVRQRIEKVLQAETVEGHRTGENPARWQGYLDQKLPRPSKVHKVGHYDEVPYAEVPAVYAELRGKKTTAARALAFTILTAARSNTVRGARWSEIDLERRIWNAPADRMKSGEPFRLPLTAEAINLLLEIKKERAATRDTGDRASSGADLLFPGASPGKPLSENTMRKMLQEDMGRAGKTVHGFRASFRSWADECTDTPREVAERALSHAVNDETEEAYLRGDMLERRRKLMDAWAKYCASAIAGDVVVPMRKAATRR